MINYYHTHVTMKIPTKTQRLRAELDIALALTDDQTEVLITLWHGYAKINL